MGILEIKANKKLAKSLKKTKPSKEFKLDFIVTSKDDEEETIKVRVFYPAARELTIHKKSLWGKVMVKKRLF